MTRNLLFVFFAFICLNLSAQETQDTSYWKKGGMASLSFYQTSLSNWSGGGDNAISTNIQLNLFANYSKVTSPCRSQRSPAKSRGNRGIFNMPCIEISEYLGKILRQLCWVKIQAILFEQLFPSRQILHSTGYSEIQ